MNESTALETQLRSWKPRPPSARLKQRLFGAPATFAAGSSTEAAALLSPASRFAWWLACLRAVTAEALGKWRRVPRIPTLPLAWAAPALTAFVLATLLIHQHSAPLSGSSELGVTLALSNHSAPASLSTSSNHDSSALPPESFEWTNGSGSTSSVSSLSGSRGTN